MKHVILRNMVLRSLIVTLAAAAGLFGQADSDWTEPFPPYHIISNIHLRRK
jgi:hypothetical protein